MHYRVLFFVLAALPVAAHAEVADHCGSRQPYHAACTLPRAGWNEEVIHLREAARHECLDNARILATDHKAAVSTAQQDRFQQMVKDHQELMRSTH